MNFAKKSEMLVDALSRLIDIDIAEGKQVKARKHFVLLVVKLG